MLHRLLPISFTPKTSSSRSLARSHRITNTGASQRERRSLAHSTRAMSLKNSLSVKIRAAISCDQIRVFRVNPGLKTCFNQPVIELPVLPRKLRIRGMLGPQSFHPELSLHRFDLVYPALDLHKQPKRQHVDHDFSVPQPPRLPAFLVNERRRETERFENRRHRVRICDPRFFFALLLDCG